MVRADGFTKAAMLGFTCILRQSGQDRLATARHSDYSYAASRLPLAGESCDKAAATAADTGEMMNPHAHIPSLTPRP
jgi:hypothetical protein